MNSTSEPLPSTGPGGPLLTGPIIVGIVLNWYLYGILLMQYYLYFNNVRKDNKFIRAIVYFLLLLDTAQTCLTMVDAFHWFVYNFGDYSKLPFYAISALDSPLMDGIIGFIVQLVYCWRVWVLGRWRVVPAIAAFLALVACANGMLIGIHDLVIKNSVAAKPIFRISVYVWCFSSAVTDIIIAVSMTYLLLKFKSRNPGRNTGSIIKRILVLTLETNALTAAAAVALSVVFLVKPAAPPRTNVYLTLGYVLGKLYSNCFMVLLNQRLSYQSSSRHAATEETGTYEPGAWRQRSAVLTDNIASHSHIGRHNLKDNTSVILISEPGMHNSAGSLDATTVLEISDPGRDKSSEIKNGSRDSVTV